MPPTLGTGKVCYLEIPAGDVQRSAAFYREAFGWRVRSGGGAPSFDDAVGEVSGTWVSDREPAAEAGILVHVMVADLDAALERVRAAGGEVVTAASVDGERVGHVRDPGGNLIGIYQQPGLAEREAEVPPVPEHLHTVTPRLIVHPAEEALDFYARAFGARELGERHTMPDGTLVHAEVEIGDSVVMIAEGDGYRALLATYWPDVDAAWDRAVDAGAAVVHPLADQFYGERGGRLEDPFGQQWMLSQRLERLTAAQIAERARAGSG